MRLTLKAWRRAKGIPTREMARRIGVTQKTYINWESNPKKISIENALKIADILEVHVNNIIFLPENSKKIG